MLAAFPFHLMAKPIGPKCNLRCRYCFYLEKEAFFAPASHWRMSDETLEAFVRQYIEAQPGRHVDFAWQGGEPTLAGVDFFRRVVALQRRYAGGRTIENALQTNGTLLDDEWGAFLAEHDFLVGLSIDGPQALHDRSRVDARGRGTWAAAMRGLEVLRRHEVAFNTLTCVSRANSGRPLEVYRFLKDIGSRHMQFIPVVEAVADEDERGQGLALGAPDGIAIGRRPVTDWSVTGEDWGRFLVTIFDRWVRHDVGNIHVQLFEVALAKWLGLPGGLCVHSEVCGAALAVEHDGSVYACDHYVYPRFRRGNLHDASLAELAGSPEQRRFGRDKRDRLPQRCRTCPVLFACRGGCPKHRHDVTAEGEEGLNHLCAGYLAFFTHIDPPMRAMADLHRRGESPALIRKILAANGRRGATSRR